MTGIRLQHSNECSWLNWIAADISRHQLKCAITYVEGFGRNQPVFRSAGMLLPVRKTWRSLFRFFVRYINREVLIGCRCWVISSSETSFGEKMKLSVPERQKLERRDSWQQVKHV